MDAVQPNAKVAEPSAPQDNTNPNQESSTEMKTSDNPGKTNLKQDARNTQVPSKKKKANNPSTSEMVLESIKFLKMRKGAPVEAICEYIEGHYEVGSKSMKPYIKRFLKTGVEKGILERVSGEGADGRFKIKKPETAKKPIVKPIQKRAGAHRGNLEEGKKVGPSGRINIKRMEGMKKNRENLKMNQTKGARTINN